MDGLGGYEGWRWIFIIEGIASVAIAVLTFFILPDSPKYGGKWLKLDEIRFLELSHFSTRGIKAKETKKGFQWGVLWSIVTDWQHYLQTMVFMSNAVPNYGLKFVPPSISIHYIRLHTDLPNRPCRKSCPTWASVGPSRSS